jgi:hypothetical protein
VAKVVPFLLARRRWLILRQAEWFAEQSPSAADANLQRQVQVQRDALLCRGVDPDAAERECRALEVAIRCQVWRLVLTPGGAA